MVSHLFPGLAFENPNHGIFIKNQLEEVRKFVDIVLYVPVDITISMGLLKKQKGIKKKLVSIGEHFKRTMLTRLNNIRHPVSGEYVRHFSIPPKSIFPFSIGISQFLRLVRKVRKNNPFDVVHGQTVVIDGFAAVILAKWLKVPVIVTARGSDIHSIGNKRLLEKTTLYVLRNANKVVCVCEDLRKKNYRYGHSRIESSHNRKWCQFKLCPIKKKCRHPKSPLHS